MYIHMQVLETNQYCDKLKLCFNIYYIVEYCFELVVSIAILVRRLLLLGRLARSHQLAVVRGAPSTQSSPIIVAFQGISGSVFL